MEEEQESGLVACIVHDWLAGRFEPAAGYVAGECVIMTTEELRGELAPMVETVHNDLASMLYAQGFRPGCVGGQSGWIMRPL